MKTRGLAMKKVLLIIFTVFVLIVATYFADKATRVKATNSMKNTEQAEPTIDGKPAPQVEFKDLEGHAVTLAKYKGTVVLVDFWATWCEPCYVEIPWLIEMQQKYAAKGFTVLGVSMDEDGKGAVVPFLTKERFTVNGQKLPMNYPIVLGNDEIADKFGGLLGYPTGFLISRDGKVIKKFQGLTSFDDIAKAIESQL